MSPVRSPEFPTDAQWLNTEQPLFLSELRGRMVLLDFWTAGCINCLHLLPELKAIERHYSDCLTVIGVHSGKFDHEQSVATVRQAIQRYDITHPVLVDRQFQVWQHYAVRAWPTLVLIDPAGYIVGQAAGEGQRDRIEQWIRTVQAKFGRRVSVAPLPAPPASDDALRPLLFPGKVLADEVHDRLLIADTGHHRLVITTLGGQVQAVIGTGRAGYCDSDWATAQFTAPQGIALSADRQQLYVADRGNHAIRQVDLQQRTVTTLAGTGRQSRYLYPHGGLAAQIDLNSPWDLVYQQGSLYIAMAGAHQIWQVQADRAQTVAGTGAEGWMDGAAEQAAFAQPSGITTDGQVLFIADSETSSIRVLDGVRSQVQTLCGSGALFEFGDRDGQGEAVRLQHCLGLCYADGWLWVADTYNHKIKQINPITGDCQTVCGTGQAGDRDGAAFEAQLNEPSGLSATSTHLYIADTNNHALRRMERCSGQVMTVELFGLCAPGVCWPT